VGNNCLLGAESIALQVGIVGPSAKGEVVQNNFHRLIGVDPARGWANQLHDELGVNMLYDRRWQLHHWRLGMVPTMRGPAVLGIDLVPSYGWAAGNILTQASAGISIRLGTGLHEMDLPARVRPSTPGAAASSAARALPGICSPVPKAAPSPATFSSTATPSAIACASTRGRS
jgi:hypothetical protein